MNLNWVHGKIANFNDGSSEMLSVFDASPLTYFNWATEYFELNFQDNNSALSTIGKIYEGEPLNRDMLYSLNKDFEHWQQLTDDLKEIQYPANFGD